MYQSTPFAVALWATLALATLSMVACAAPQTSPPDPSAAAIAGPTEPEPTRPETAPQDPTSPEQATPHDKTETSEPPEQDPLPSRPDGEVKWHDGEAAPYQCRQKYPSTQPTHGGVLITSSKSLALQNLECTTEPDWNTQTLVLAESLPSTDTLVPIRAVVQKGKLLVDVHQLGQCPGGASRVGTTAKFIVLEGRFRTGHVQVTYKENKRADPDCAKYP